MKSSHALKRWLVREIHGRDIPRKPPQMASKLKQGPARNSRYKAWIRSLPCASCDRTPSEAAHTGSDGGLKQKASDYSCIPLCTDCHTQAAGSYHQIGRAEFERRHQLDIRGLVKRLNRLWFKAYQEGA